MHRIRPSSRPVNTVHPTASRRLAATLGAAWRDAAHVHRPLALSGVATALLLALFIVGQVLRGAASHFNVATGLDVALWSLMGTAIGVLFVANVIVTGLLLTRRFADRALGDLRVGHFVGLHALQVLPLVWAWLRLRPGLSQRRRTHLVTIAAAAYLGLTLLVTWQALRAQPLLQPDALTLAVLMALVGATAAATHWAVRKPETEVTA